MIVCEAKSWRCNNNNGDGRTHKEAGINAASEVDILQDVNDGN